MPTNRTTASSGTVVYRVGTSKVGANWPADTRIGTTTVVGASPTLTHHHGGGPRWWATLPGVVRGRVVVCDRRGRAPVRPGGMGAAADATRTAAAGVDGRCMAQPSPEAPAVVAPAPPGAAPPAPLTPMQR